MTRRHFVPAALAFYALLTLLALGGAWIFDLPAPLAPGPDLLAAWTAEDGTALHQAMGWRLGLGLAIALGFLGPWMLAVRVWPHARALEGAIAARIGPISRLQAWALATASAIGEEAMFRGLLQAVLGPWFQAIPFALLHQGPDARFRAWPWLSLGIGLIFGAATAHTGDIGAAVVGHAVINGVQLTRLGTRHRD